MTDPGRSVPHAVSVVIPVYQGARTLPPLLRELAPMADGFNTPLGYRARIAEVLLVHDNGPDDSAKVIRELAEKYDFVRPVWLSRNYGQHPATLAGMASSGGDWIVTMDEDGQHDPAAIGPMLDVAMTEQADTTLDDHRYRFLMKRVRRQTPFVLLSGDSVWSARPGVHDVTVISPRAVHRGGRPSWIWTMGGGVRRAYIASDEACPGSLDCIVTARRVGESDDAVPVDILRVQFSAPGSKTFALPPGQFVIEARDGSGTALSRQTITVAPAR